MSWPTLALLFYFGAPTIIDALGALSWARAFGGPGYEVWVEGEVKPRSFDTLPTMCRGVMLALGKKHWWTRHLPAPFFGVRWLLATLTWPLWLDLRVEAYRRIRDMDLDDLDFT